MLSLKGNAPPKSSLDSEGNQWCAPVLIHTNSQGSEFAATYNLLFCSVPDRLAGLILKITAS